jgi:hypothetical protein
LLQKLFAPIAHLLKLLLGYMILPSGLSTSTCAGMYEVLQWLWMLARVLTLVFMIANTCIYAIEINN